MAYDVPWPRGWIVEKWPGDTLHPGRLSGGLLRFIGFARMGRLSQDHCQPGLPRKCWHSPHLLGDPPGLLQVLLGVNLGHVGPGMAQRHLGGLDAVLPPDLGPAVVPQLVGMPVRDREAGLLRLLEPVFYRPAVRIGIVPVPLGPLRLPLLPAGLLQLLPPLQFARVDRRLPLPPW